MDALAAIGDPQLRETLVWVRRQPAAVTADEVAAAQNVHRNVARSRLERLAKAGLLQVGFERRSGRTGPGAGRPAKTYAVAPELEAAEFPVRRYDRLIGLLMDALPSRGRSERLRELGTEFGRTLAEHGRLRTAAEASKAAEQVCETLRKLGYQAAVAESDAARVVIATPTCPLRPLVATTPGASDVDRGMWAGLFAAASGVEPDTIRCELHDCLDGESMCRVHVSLPKR